MSPDSLFCPTFDLRLVLLLVRSGRRPVGVLLRRVNCPIGADHKCFFQTVNGLNLDRWQIHRLCSFWKASYLFRLFPT